MSGRPGRSGGWNKLSPEEHRMRGTTPRSGPRPPALAWRPARLPRRSVPAPLLEGLDGHGQAFVEECWRSYQGWTPATWALLREAGFLLTQVEAQRAEPKEQRATQRTLLAVLAALPLPAADIAVAVPAPPSKWRGELA